MAKLASFSIFRRREDGDELKTCKERNRHMVISDYIVAKQMCIFNNCTLHPDDCHPRYINSVRSTTLNLIAGIFTERRSFAGEHLKSVARMPPEMFH